jgi:hypothetical protein
MFGNAMVGGGYHFCRVVDTDTTSWKNAFLRLFISLLVWAGTYKLMSFFIKELI